MTLYIGTSGYSYKEWKGSFYPEKIPAKDMLHYYAERLSTVEINATFYRLPQPSMLENWKEQVPSTFRFSLKASQRITHFKRLKETDEVTKYFLETAAVLGDQLGVILFQLPPNMKKDLPRLETFLTLLPATTPAAFEFAIPPGLTMMSWIYCAAITAHSSFPILTTCSYAHRQDCRLGYLRLRRVNYSEENWSSGPRAYAIRIGRRLSFFQTRRRGHRSETGCTVSPIGSSLIQDYVVHR